VRRSASRYSMRMLRRARSRTRTAPSRGDVIELGAPGNILRLPRNTGKSEVAAGPKYRQVCWQSETWLNWLLGLATRSRPRSQRLAGRPEVIHLAGKRAICRNENRVAFRTSQLTNALLLPFAPRAARLPTRQTFSSPRALENQIILRNSWPT
jgi:hypothetical protein